MITASSRRATPDKFLLSPTEKILPLVSCDNRHV